MPAAVSAAGAASWSVETGTRETTLVGHSEDINTLVFHPDGTQLISGSGYFDDSTNESRDSTVRLWDVPTGRQISIVGTHQYRIISKPQVRAGCTQLVVLRVPSAIKPIHQDDPSEAARWDKEHPKKEAQS
jgi:WD40 repeat protein